MFESDPTTPVTLDQFSPRNHPAPISSAFQAADPKVVSSAKRQTGIFDKPAGIETTLRANGTIRPKSTIQLPYLSNQPSARSRSASVTRSMRL